MEALKGLVESSQGHPWEEVMTHWPAAGEQVNPVKLTDAGIDVYLTTFECMMQVVDMEEETRAIRLVPQMTGKTQQAYAAMRDRDSTDYKQVKKAILKLPCNKLKRRRDVQTYTELEVHLGKTNAFSCSNANQYKNVKLMLAGVVACQNNYCLSFFLFPHSIAYRLVYGNG